MRKDNLFTKVAEQIFSPIKKAKKILIPLHLNPDGDSVASALAFGHVLEKIGKKALIVSANPIPPEFSFLPNFEQILHKDPAEVEPALFDLLILLDPSASVTGTPLERVSKQNFVVPKEVPIVYIDHHPGKERFGEVSFIDSEKSSTCEILYGLFSEWKIKIDEKLATLLLFGIFSDTGCFQFNNTSSSVFSTASQLLKMGAPLGEFVYRIYRSIKFGTLKFWGKCLENLKIDYEGKFAWTTISFKELKTLRIDLKEAFGFHNAFLHNIDGTDFGFILTEYEPGVIKGSFRARTDFDVSKIAKVLGGGGHKAAAGFILKMGLPEAEKKVLETVKKFT